MKSLITLNKFLLFAALLFIALPFAKSLKAQTAPPGVSFIMVTFDQPPTDVVVEKADLRYDKKICPQLSY